MVKRQPAQKPAPRKKACIPCSDAKQRCDRRRTHCTRCLKRGIQELCIYPTSGSSISKDSPADGCIVVTPEEGTADGNTILSLADGTPRNYSYPPSRLPALPHTLNHSPANSASSGQLMTSAVPGYGPLTSLPKTPVSVYRNPGKADEPLDFADLDLICVVNPEEIRNRWLRPFLPSSEETLKSYLPQISSFMRRMLRAYTSMLIHTGTFPPFVHISQYSINTVPAALAACMSLVRSCQRPLPESRPVIQETLTREMARLLAQYRELDEPALLATFQAYLIYTAIIYLNFDETNPMGCRQFMIDLQDIACEMSRRGLVSSAQQKQSRPKWESWIMAEAKRRTLYTMCILDNILSEQDGLPTFLSTELQSIPAPAPKCLWQCTDRKEWNQLFNGYLHEWGDDGPLRIEELWPMPRDWSAVEVEARRSRVDQWLMAVDEFGTMLYAITSCTHGS